MYGSVLALRRCALLALALIFGIALGRADAEVLPNTPQPQGGDLTGSWTADMTSLRAYVPAALVTAVTPTFEGETQGTITFGSNGTVQADYTTHSVISAVLILRITVPVPDTSQYTGNYSIMSDTHELVITRENADTLRYTYTATADSLFIMRPLLLEELLASLSPLEQSLARNTLEQHVPEDDPIKIVISFAKAPLAADFNGDRNVDFTDFLAFVGAFGKAPGDPGYDARMDLNSSGGPIDFNDFLVFVSAYGTRG